MSAPAEASLYERLGGVYSIAAVVDDFIDRITDNPKKLRARRAISHEYLRSKTSIYRGPHGSPIAVQLNTAGEIFWGELSAGRRCIGCPCKANSFAGKA